MPGIERIWRIMTDSNGKIEVRLAHGAQGNSRVSLDRDTEQADGTFAVEDARAVAQAMLEACEVAWALAEQEQTEVIR